MTSKLTGNHILCGVNHPVSYSVNWLVILHVYLEEEPTSEMSVKPYQAKQRHISEDDFIYSLPREPKISRVFFFVDFFEPCVSLRILQDSEFGSVCNRDFLYKNLLEIYIPIAIFQELPTICLL